MYGFTMSMRSVAASSACSIASLIGWWPSPGTLSRTVVRAAIGPASAAGNRWSSASVVGRQDAALVPERGQEEGLELADDRPRHADHRVVEALVGVVVLDAGPADERDPAVDDEHLPVLEVHEVVHVPVEPPRAEQAVAIGHEPVVGDDRDAGRRQLGVQGLRVEVDLAADRVDGQPDLDAGLRPGDQGIAERRADLARLEAVDEQVHGRRRALDRLEHRREVAPAVQVRLHARRDARREGHDPVVAARPVPSAAISMATPCAMSSVMASGPGG